MAFNVGPSDVVKAIQLAYQIYEFYQKNPKREFADFANDIYNLASHLKLLDGTLGTLQANARSAPPTVAWADVSGAHTDPWQADSLREVLGDYKGTLQRADKLLKAGVGITNSTASRTRWALDLEPKVIQVRERIHAHSLKITTIVQSMQLGSNITLATRLDIAVNHIISVLSRRNENSGAWFTIPDWFRARLNAASLNAVDIPQKDADFPMRKGVNGFLYHFDQSTITFSVDAATQNLAPSADQWINLMKSKYVLEKIKGSAEYQFKVQQRHDLIWSHFIFQLEEKCLAEFRRFSEEEQEDRRLHAPTQDVIAHRGDEEFQLWLKEDDNTIDDPGPGIEIVNAILVLDLASPNQHEDHELRLHRIDNTHLGMQRMINPRDGSRHKTNEKSSIDLATIKLKPLWILSRDRQALNMTYTNAFETDEVLPFTREKDMWKFQHAVTAYQVIHHELSVETDSYHSKAGSENGIASIQIWREKRIDSEFTFTQDLSAPNSPNTSHAAFGQSGGSLNSRPRAASNAQSPPPHRPSRNSDANMTSYNTAQRRTSSIFSQTSRQSSYQTALTCLTKDSLADTRIEEPLEPKVVVFLTVTSDHRRGEIYYLSLQMMNGFEPLLFLNRQCKCRRPHECVHVLLAAKSGFRIPLTAQALVATPNDTGPPSIAALGAYQNNAHTKPPGLTDVTKLLRLELTFKNAARRVAFEEKFRSEQERFVNYKKFYHSTIEARKLRHT